MKKNLFISLLALATICTSAFGTAKKEVIYVRSAANYRDSLVIDAIAGYKDSSIYNVTELIKSILTQDDLATLNAADVVIMGRNIGSYDVAASMGIWDSITKPVLALNMWGMRNSRAKWMDDGTIVVGGSAGSVLKAVVHSDDPILKSLTDTIDWWNDDYNVFSIKSAGNGEVLVRTADSIPLFVRWKAGEEFYSGAGHYPLADRSFIGCASDQTTPINYFGYTETSENIFFKELGRLAGVPVKVIYIRSAANYRDSAVIDAIAKYADSSMFKVTELIKSILTQDDLATLNTADVVIMGRNIGSYDVAASMGVYDSITKPVLALNMWGMRNSRAKWMDDGTIVVGGSAGNVLKAVVHSDDPILEGLTDTIDWWNDDYNVFSIKNAGNGEVLVRTADSIPLFVRWKAGEEFYSGAGHYPLADRSFIGCASDQTTPINYFGYTVTSENIFFKELVRLSGIKVVVLPIKKISTLSSLTASAGKISPVFKGSVLEYTVTLPFGSTELPTLTYTATDASASINVVNATSLAENTTITVTAEDTTVKSVYVVSFAIEAAKTDATLSDLTVSSGTLDPKFDPDVTEYTVTLPAGTTAIPTVSATANDETATLVIVDATAMGGDATVTVTAQDVTVTKVYTITIDVEEEEGIDYNGLYNLKVYPSPATSELRISGVDVNYVEVFNITGRLVNTSEGAVLKVSDLSEGIYVLKVYTTDNTYTTRFVKK